ncbi:CocE/NonD family hydrolase [Hominifimenecus sp. rT4P-3]|uniref:CocE/NonD family hydrolase n=1 Tax=Hominifimenecus sp. rT4P-3 TaxID=3242979 RepID=UPI003DA1CE56
MNFKCSLPGRYAGYTEPTYTGQIKTSFYIASQDGVRLAADLILPDPLLPESRLPAILIASRGGRFDPEKGNGDSIVAPLIPYGYAVMVVELRGCGASFGVNDSFGSKKHVQDAMAAIRWICAQPWSNGRVAMAGISNRSYIQLCTASYAPEGLTAVTPTVAITDFYYQNYPNGVSSMPFLSSKDSPAQMDKETFLEKVSPVDEDPDGSMAYQAYQQDQYGKNKFFVGHLLTANMNRDTPNPNLGGEKTNLTLPPLFRFRSLPRESVKQHQFIGQLESGALGQLAHYLEQGGSFVLGPWTHFQSRTGNPQVPEGMFDFTAEYHRYYDAVLTDKENGFLDAPPVTYYTFHAKDGEHWRVADCWPLENERRAIFYLTPEKSGTADSTNDGTLSQEKPDTTVGTNYQTDLSISVFDHHDGKGSTYNRMSMCWEGDMAQDVDAKGLTFTSLPFFPVYENILAGCVSVDLWVSSTAPDGDFIAYLEEVMEDGTSHFIKDGVIRASHRTSASNPAWEAMGATWHTSMTEDVEHCLDLGMAEPIHLQFAIEPIVYQFRRGSRLRLTITCADPHTYQHPMYEKALPTITLYQGGEHASFISVPFLEHEENGYNGHVTTTEGEGPGTLYFFKKNVYLYYNGAWRRMSVESGEADYYLQGYDAIFPSAGFTFRVEGAPIKDGILQDYQGGESTCQPLAAFRHLTVDTVPVCHSDHALFVPTRKTLKLDVFSDGTRSDPAPCILHIHGYGGSYSVFSPQLQALYDAGYTIVGIDLRNYPSNPFPDYVHDVKGAIRYVRANAERFGIDPNRIGCYGLSLGGNSTLMAAVSGEVPELEGCVGGNLHVSSRLQAAAAGFAWSELLYMGKDIVEEYQCRPEQIEQKRARTDGEFAPCAEVIHFAGKGQGIGALRRYLEEGKSGSDPQMDQKADEAIAASPNTYIGPDCPPIALFGGYGAWQVDIALNQTLRSFWKFHEYDVTCFLFANTQGEYGRKPEIIHAIVDFFDHYLKEAGCRKLVIRRQGGVMVVDGLPVPEQREILRLEKELYIDVSYLQGLWGISIEADWEENGRFYRKLTEKESIPGLQIREFPAKDMVTITPLS